MLFYVCGSVSPRCDPCDFLSLYVVPFTWAPLIYKTFSSLLWPHKCAFSCIGHEWPPLDQHIEMMLLFFFFLPCGAFKMKQREGGWWGSGVEHPQHSQSSMTGFFFLPLSSFRLFTWSMVGHEYSAKGPLFITMQQRSMCALCMFTL